VLQPIHVCVATSRHQYYYSVCHPCSHRHTLSPMSYICHSRLVNTPALLHTHMLCLLPLQSFKGAAHWAQAELTMHATQRNSGDCLRVRVGYAHTQLMSSAVTTPAASLLAAGA
jgi:hypothetical protein